MTARRLELIEFDGVMVWCHGRFEGVPEFGWRSAPRHLATRTQLKARGLTPGRRADVVAVVRFHTRRWGWVIGDLYRVSECVPRPADTPGRARARRSAMLARRTCRGCKQVGERCVSSRSGLCGACRVAAGELDEAA